MVRLIVIGGCLVVFLVVVAVTGCGGDDCDDTGACAAPRTETDAAASPPDATANTGGENTLLAVGGFCWTRGSKGLCATSLPASARTDLPVLRVRSGDEVRFAFQFDPKEVLVELQGEDDSRLLVSEVNAKASTFWSVPVEASAAAFMVVRAKAAPGDVAYVAQIEAG